MAKRLTEALWAKARADREHKGLSFHDLAQKYGVSSATIHRRAKSDGWSEPVDVDTDVQTKRNETDETKRNETQGNQSNSFHDKVKKLRAKVKPACLSEEPEVISETKRNETANETDRSFKRIATKADQETVNHSLHPSHVKNKNLRVQLESIDEHLGDLVSIFDGMDEDGGKYRPQFAKIAYNIAMLGGTPERLASTLSVCEKTVHNWLNTYPEFRLAWIGGKDFADAEVVRALHKKAVGYTFSVEDFKVYKGDLIPYEKTITVEPDVNAQRFWLINRQPNEWKDKVEVQENISVAVIDTDAADQRYERVLNEAENLRASFAGRAERMGLILDGDNESDVDD